MFWELIPTFGQATGEKLIGKEFFYPLLSWIGLIDILFSTFSMFNFQIKSDDFFLPCLAQV